MGVESRGVYPTYRAIQALAQGRSVRVSRYSGGPRWGNSFSRSFTAGRRVRAVLFPIFSSSRMDVRETPPERGLVDNTRSGVGITQELPQASYLLAKGVRYLVEHMPVSIDGTEAVYVMVREQGKTVGMVKILVDEPNRGWVGPLFVAESHRSRGLGRALLEQAAKLCRSTSRNIMALVCKSDNPAMKLYLKFGFQDYGEHRAGYREMVKVLAQ